MRRTLSDFGLVSDGTSFSESRIASWVLAGISDSILVLGLLTVLSGMAGVGDNNTDATKFLAIGILLIAIGTRARRRVVRPTAAPPNRIIAGIGILWCTLTVLGAVVYLATGTISRVDDALVESAAGFTTTALTTLDVEDVSRTVLLWRASTSWVGGLAAILVAVVALPEALRRTALLAFSTRDRGLDLVPNAITGRRRVAVIYTAFTTVLIAGYSFTGLAPTSAVVHGLSTASTGGFSTNADSFVGYGNGPRIMATVGMTLAGASIFVLWWIIRGRLRPLWRSQELRAYITLLAVATTILLLDVPGLSVGDALFTVASLSSTTGLAVGDWTAFADDAQGVLLVLVGIGSMLGSAGGGFHVLRARLLLGYAQRELRRQLDPHAVVVVRLDGTALTDRTLDRVGGYQIAHLAVLGGGAILLATTGMSLLGSIFASVSAVSTLGPASGEVGAFGQVDGLTRPMQLALVPLMIAGRVSILPLLALVGFVLEANRSVGRQLRRGVRAAQRAFNWSSGGRDSA